MPRSIILSVGISSLLLGCGRQPYAPQCHDYDTCPELLYSWKPKPADPKQHIDANAKGIPYLLEATPPVYPKDAWDNRIEGEAVFAFDVSGEGKLINIVIVRSQPKGVFDKAGIEAVELSRYSSTKDGAEGYERTLTWSIQ